MAEKFVLNQATASNLKVLRCIEVHDWFVLITEVTETYCKGIALNTFAEMIFHYHDLDDIIVEPATTAQVRKYFTDKQEQLETAVASAIKRRDDFTKQLNTFLVQLALP